MSGSWNRPYDSNMRRPTHHGESSDSNSFREEGEISRDNMHFPASQPTAVSQPLLSRVDPRRDQLRLNHPTYSGSTGVPVPSRSEVPFQSVQRFAPTRSQDRDPRFRAHSTSPPAPRNNNPASNMGNDPFYYSSFPEDVPHRNMNHGPSWKPPDRAASFSQRRVGPEFSDSPRDGSFPHTNTPKMNRSFSVSDVGSRYDYHNTMDASPYMIDGIGVPIPGPKAHKWKSGSGGSRGGRTEAVPWEHKNSPWSSSKPTATRVAPTFLDGNKQSDMTTGFLNKFDRRAPPGGWDRDVKHTQTHDISSTHRDYYGPSGDHRDRPSGTLSQIHPEKPKTTQEHEYDEDLFSDNHVTEEPRSDGETDLFPSMNADIDGLDHGHDTPHSPERSKSQTPVYAVHETTDTVDKSTHQGSILSSRAEVENSMVTGSPEKKTGSVIRITLSSLGNEEKISKAELAIRRLADLMSLDDLNSMKVDGSLVLPSTQQIMLGISHMDNKIKEYERDLVQLRMERDDLLKKEQQEEAEQLQREEELKKKRELDIAKKYQDCRNVENMRRDEARSRCQQDISTWKATMQSLTAQRNTAVREVQDNMKESLARDVKKMNEEASSVIESIQSSYWAEITSSVQALVLQARGLLESETVTIHELTSKLKACGSDELLSLHDGTNEDESNEIDIFKKNPGLSSIYPLLRDDPQSMSDIVSSVMIENRKRAKESHLDSLSMIPCSSENDSDTAIFSFHDINHSGEYEWTNEHWSRLTRLVTGPENALYTEPSQTALFYESNVEYLQKRHLVREHIRSKKRKLYHRWKELCLECVALQRSQLNTPKDLRGSFIEYSDVPTLNFEAQEQLGVRGNNPYRRPRRVANLGSGPSSIGSDIVRSEYEQEQIIAQLTAQEALEKKIIYGGCSLPRQRCKVEKALFVSYQDSISSRRVHDPFEELDELKCQNPWSDMEKCIFLDKFLQHPKDFRKIASYLRNKSVRDCIAFYYDSKQSVPYKAALKEHLLRRKRRGEPTNWEATMQAAVSVGAVISPGSSVEKPVIFSLPMEENTYSSRHFHPLRRERIVNIVEEDSFFNCGEKGKTAKELPIPVGRLFSIDISQNTLYQSNDDSDQKMTQTVVSWDESQTSKIDGSKDDKIFCDNTARKVQKWTKEEKRIFLNAFEKHGKNWPLLAQAVGTKSVNQIKNYYYDNKRQINKLRSHSELGNEAKNNVSDPENIHAGAASRLNDRAVASHLDVESEIQKNSGRLNDFNYHSFDRATHQRAEMWINSSLQQSVALTMDRQRQNPTSDLRHLPFPVYSQPYGLPFFDPSLLLTNVSPLQQSYVPDAVYRTNCLLDTSNYMLFGQTNLSSLYHPFTPDIASLAGNLSNRSNTHDVDQEIDHSQN